MKKIKLAIAVIGLLAIGTTNAQQVTGNVGANEKIGKSSLLNGTVRVIDNKGTKKYLQVKNGLTLLTDQTPDGGIVSTWQLGGTLTNATNIATGTNEFKITLDTGGTFILDGVLRESGAPAVADAADAVDGIANTGYTFLVRDEATGQTKKLLPSDLIQSGQTVFTANVADAVAGPTVSELTFDVTGAGRPVPLPDFSKVWVFRNGAKLVANLDYTITGATVVLVPNTTAPNDWTLYAGDVIEIQYIK